jgi:hypothetical protein
VPRTSALRGAIEVDPGPQEAPRRPADRDDTGGMRPCPACGQVVHRDRWNCSACGERLGNGAADRWDDRPFARRGLPPRRDCEPHRGNTILVLGVLCLSCLVFFMIPILPALVGVVLGIIALWMAQGDVRRIQEGTMDPAGRNSTQAGRVCALIGTILNFVWLLTCGGCIGMQWYMDTQRNSGGGPIFQPPPPPQVQPKDKDKPKNANPAAKDKL